MILGYFLTKIFHPNISEKGEICVNTLKKDWNPLKWSLYNIFEVIKKNIKLFKGIIYINFIFDFQI